MGLTAVSPPAALPALTAQFFRLALVVPHLPELLPVPTVPVTTLNVVLGSRPVVVIVAYGGMPLTLQPDWPLALTRHSTMYTVSPALKPLPETWTVSPLRRFVDGLTTNFGPEAPDALETLTRPLESPVMPKTAMLNATRSPLTENILPPSCSGSSKVSQPRHATR